MVDAAVELLREWLTADPYAHDWIDFEERVQETVDANLRNSGPER